MGTKNWQIKSRLHGMEGKRLPEIIQLLLKNRGITSKKNQQLFFASPDPHHLTLENIKVKTSQIKKVLKRLEEAFNKKHHIIIYGDYDADGITSTAILWETLFGLGFKVMPFIPDRQKHGYGMKPLGITAAIKQHGKPKLIITVDNGIVAFKGSEYCLSHGIDLILCDHHKPLQQSSKNLLPKALAIIHSEETSGAGLSFLLAKQILKHFSNSHSKTANQTDIYNHLLELAAIGIIADLVPLTGLTRSLAKHGLRILPQTKRKGLQALMNLANLNNLSVMSTYHVGFVIAPRLNATGRLEHSLDALRLLCTTSDARALALAQTLNELNKTRQDITLQSTENVLNTLGPKLEKIIIVDSDKFHPGIIGLIASKLTEKFHRPAIVIAKTGEVAKGSVRSVSNINIIKLLQSIREEFIDLGGHPLAAGFTIASENIGSFQKRLLALANAQILNTHLVPTLSVDTGVALTDLSLELYQEIQKFSPFGLGNPHPVFSSTHLKIVSLQSLGRNTQHLKLYLKKTTTLTPNGFEAIFFNAGEWLTRLKVNDLIDVAYQLDLNTFSGQKLQLVVKDIKYTQ